jgi:hypothetical protein
VGRREPGSARAGAFRADGIEDADGGTEADADGGTEADADGGTALPAVDGPW